MNLIMHAEIPVSDLEGAIRFYTSVFGATFGEVATLHGSKMAHFPFEEDYDGASGALAEGDVYVPTLHGAIIYLSVADLDVVLTRVLGEGSEILSSKTSLGDDVLIAEIRDSEGNRIALQSAYGERPQRPCKPSITGSTGKNAGQPGTPYAQRFLQLADADTASSGVEAQGGTQRQPAASRQVSGCVQLALQPPLPGLIRRQAARRMATVDQFVEDVGQCIQISCR